MKKVELTEEEISVILTAIEEYEYRVKKKMGAEKLNDSTKVFPYYKKKLKALSSAKIILERTRKD